MQSNHFPSHPGSSFVFGAASIPFPNYDLHLLDLRGFFAVLYIGGGTSQFFIIAAHNLAVISDVTLN